MGSGFLLGQLRAAGLVDDTAEHLECRPICPVVDLCRWWPGALL